MRMFKLFKMGKDDKNKAQEELSEDATLEQDINDNTAEEQDADQTETSEQEASSDNDQGQQIAELKDKYVRLFAEFENYKRRTAKERIELIKTASQDAIAALLPVIDDFDRAKKIADDPESTEQFSDGVTLVYDKLKKTLANKGLKAMESTGEDFDPEFHEAITEIPAPTEDMKGKVIDTVETGYFLNDKIIRYAKVVVGK